MQGMLPDMMNLPQRRWTEKREKLKVGPGLATSVGADRDKDCAALTDAPESA